MSFYVCSVHGTGACRRCLDLNSFRFRSSLHFRMWQRPEYRALVGIIPYSTIVIERKHAARLGQLRKTCD